MIPLRQGHIYAISLRAKAEWMQTRNNSHDALLQIPLAKTSKMLIHKFLDVLGCNFVDYFAEIHGRCIPFFDHSIDESLVDDKGIMVW